MVYLNSIKKLNFFSSKIKLMKRSGFDLVKVLFRDRVFHKKLLLNALLHLISFQFLVFTIDVRIL